MNSSKLKGYLTGLILGDGHIDKGVSKRAFSIKSINFDFIEEIQSTLSETTNFTMYIKQIPSSYKDGVNRKAYQELRIKAHPYFAKKYHYFYNDFKKRVITTTTLSWLNLEGLANWYMSDGYITLVGKTKGIIKDRRVELSTDRYSYNDVLKIKRYFEESFGYKVKIIDRKRNNQYRIRISLKDAQDFFVMIRPHVVDSFLYKLDMKYDYKPEWMTEEYYSLMKYISQRESPEKGDDIV